MFARVSTIEGKADRIDDGIKDYREHVVPEVKKMTGFKGGYLLVDRKTGKTLSITLWDTEKDLQASTRAANKLRANASQTVAAAMAPKVEIYEVAVQP
jgi:heme-degrading monooxygenase HmoA